jgi:ribonuclease BN (tRNA processing enzyme)
VQSNSIDILLDCGSGVLMQLQNYLDLKHLDAAVISQNHWDHIADIGCLQYASRVLMDLGKRKRPLHIYGPGEDANFERLTYLSYTVAHGYDAAGAPTIGDFSFSFSRNVHPDPCFSMRIEKNKKPWYILPIHNGRTIFYRFQKTRICCFANQAFTMSISASFRVI